MKPFWEKTYADLETKSFGEISSEIADLIPLLPKNAEVLDMGCGDGRNTIPLLKAGFNVTAVDLSRAGISKLEKLAQKDNLKVKTVLSDMSLFIFPHKYDLIISQGCLHFLNRRDWKIVLSRFKSYTKTGGFNAITVFTDKVDAPPDLADICVGLFKEKELFTHYSDWEILLKKSYIFHDEHAGGLKHTHASDKLVVKKS